MKSQSDAAKHEPAESGVHFLKIAAVLFGVLLVLYVKSGDILLVVNPKEQKAVAVLKIQNKDVARINIVK
jgi:hypothetical protein